MLPGFLGTERDIPGYCVGQIVSITLQLLFLLWHCNSYLETAYNFASMTVFFFVTGFVAARSTPFESFLMSSMTDENPPFLDEFCLDVSRIDGRESSVSLGRCANRGRRE